MISLIVLALSGLLGQSPLNSAPSTPNLLSNASRITTIPDGMRQGFGVACVWLSDHEILQWKGQYPHGQPVVFDTATGQEKSSAAFLPSASSPDALGLWTVLSPNSQWALEVRGQNRQGARWTVISEDGSRFMEGTTVSEMWYARCSWAEDNQHWLTVLGDCKTPVVQIYSRLTPSAVQEIYLPKLLCAHGRSQETRPTLLGAMPDGRLLLTTSAMRDNHDILFYRIDIKGLTVTPYYRHAYLLGDKPGQLLRTQEIYDYDLSKPAAIDKQRFQSYRVKILRGCRVDDIRLSPHGDKLAWQLYRYQPGSHTVKPHATVEIWQSKVDGSGMQCLGTQAIEPPKKRDSDFRSDDFPTTLGFQPNKPSVSFWYQGTFYALPLQ